MLCCASCTAPIALLCVRSGWVFSMQHAILAPRPTSVPMASSDFYTARHVFDSPVDSTDTTIIPADAEYSIVPWDQRTAQMRGCCITIVVYVYETHLLQYIACQMMAILQLHTHWEYMLETLSKMQRSVIYNGHVEGAKIVFFEWIEASRYILPTGASRRRVFRTMYTD